MRAGIPCRGIYATKVIFRLIMIIGRPTGMGRTPYSINDRFPRIFQRMIVTCVAGGARKCFREGVVSGASECGAPEPDSPAEDEIILPLQYSRNYYVIGEPAAPGEGRRSSA